MRDNYVELPSGCSIPNPEGVIALLKRYGYHGLGGCDGCRCASFAVLAVHVDVSCHKSAHTVRVYSHYLGFSHTELRPVAAEVMHQLGPDVAAGYRVRYCDWKFDNKNGRRENGVWVKDSICVYCEKPRTDLNAYLCEVCTRDNPRGARDQHPPDDAVDPADGRVTE